MNPKHIVVNISTQTLSLYEADSEAQSKLDVKKPDNDNEFVPNELKLIKEFSVSTAKNGIGSLEGTGCTPLGQHVIEDKIGEGMQSGTVFVGRQPTGEVYDDTLGEEHPDRDWILSRIMWLKGREPGINLGENDQGCCDTYQRYIYIHGTPDTEPMGEPLSHGCIRMRNDDIIWLFDQVEEGTAVSIIRA